MDRKKTACFTGHRPEKIPGYGDPDGNLVNMIRSMLYYRIYEAIQAGYIFFISGVSRGVDLWAAESVLYLKRDYPHIKLICAKPFPEHGDSFTGKELWSFSNVIEKADEVICVRDGYSHGCYHARNKFMVDSSARLIGVIDNYKSGTGQTINYAKKSGLELSLIKISDIVQATGYTEKKSQIFFD